MHSGRSSFPVKPAFHECFNESNGDAPSKLNILIITRSRYMEKSHAPVLTFLECQGQTRVEYELARITPRVP